LLIKLPFFEFIITIFNKGHPRLIQAVSKLYGNAIGRNIDPLTEILVTGGAFEGDCCKNTI
jgi:aspartate/methionine/tyrosine aminotransferase